MNSSNSQPSTIQPARPAGASRKLPGPLARAVPPIAGTRLFPFWAVLRHVGRTSGKPYSTAVVARRTPDGFVIPMPFGEGTNWVKNLLAAGGGTLRVGGRDREIRDPEIVSFEEVRSSLGFIAERGSKAFGIRTFLRVRTV